MKTRAERPALAAVDRLFHREARIAAMRAGLLCRYRIVLIMFKGAALFLLIFVVITPQSREFISNLVGHTSETLNEWGSLSYVILAALAGALILSIVMVKTWPTRADPENPMTKYKKQVPFEE